LNWNASILREPENVSDVTVDPPKLAMPVGTVAGVQFPAVLKSGEPGIAFQVASCAAAGAAISADDASSATRSRAR
jgi:hypothetical protein